MFTGAISDQVVDATGTNRSEDAKRPLRLHGNGT